MLTSFRGHPITLFAGRSNPMLAERIAESYGQNLGNLIIKEFSDGEIYCRYDESIRGTDIFIIQSTCPPGENWLELLLLIDAAKRASAARVTAVIPYFGYARQERKDQPRVSIAAKLMAQTVLRVVEQLGNQWGGTAISTHLQAALDAIMAKAT